MECAETRRDGIGVGDPGDDVVEALAHRGVGDVERDPTVVRDLQAHAPGGRRSTMVRVTRPRSTSVSTVADTVGFVSASRPAISLARSAPAATIASNRYWASVTGGSRSVQARSSTRARRARVRTS